MKLRFMRAAQDLAGIAAYIREQNPPAALACVRPFLNRCGVWFSPRARAF
jgi:hypothetical protein